MRIPENIYNNLKTIDSEIIYVNHKMFKGDLDYVDTKQIEKIDSLNDDIIKNADNCYGWCVDNLTKNVTFNFGRTESKITYIFNKENQIICEIDNRKFIIDLENKFLRVSKFSLKNNQKIRKTQKYKLCRQKTH